MIKKATTQYLSLHRSLSRRFCLVAPLLELRLSPRDVSVEVFAALCRVGLQSRDDSWLSNLIWSAVIHVHCREEKDITLLGYARRDCLHDLSVDGLLIICDEILVQQLLNLSRRKPGNRG
ncbi:hypothetical protein TMatcc_007742 [Talaromyces marneffei ATCC 18224]